MICSACLMFPSDKEIPRKTDSRKETNRLFVIGVYSTFMIRAVPSIVSITVSSIFQQICILSPED